MPFCFEFCNAAFQRKRKYFIASLVFCCALFPWRVFASEAPITIGFPLVSHPWSASRFLEQSLNYLNWKIPTYSFQAKWISVDDIEKAFDEGKLDLAVFPSGYLIDEKTRQHRLLMTMVSREAPDPDAGTACAVIVKRSSPIKSLSELSNVPIASANKHSVQGFLACLRELEKLGTDTDKLTKDHVYFLGDLNEKNVIREVTEGRASAGFIRAGLIEDIKKANAANVLEDIRVLSGPYAGPAFLKSSESYPGPTLVANTKLPAETVHEIMAALFSMPPDSWGQRWTAPANMSSIEELSEQLRIGSYEYLRHWTLKRTWDIFWPVFFVIFILIIALLTHGWMTEKTVQKRTHQLRRSLVNQRLAERKAQKRAERIEFLEKRSLVGQLSSIVAHELNTPLAAIQNITYMLRSRIDSALENNTSVDSDELESIEEQLESIETQALKAGKIVDKVRSYSKPNQQRKTVSDLLRAAKEACEVYAKKADVKFENHCKSGPVYVHFDEIELELVVHNLLKNAFEASSTEQKSMIFCSLKYSTDNSVVLTITDNGSPLTKAAFDNITSQSRVSTKAHGLGLGLDIVCSLIEKNEGKIAFTLSKTRSLITTITLRSADRELISASQSAASAVLKNTSA